MRTGIQVIKLITSGIVYGIGASLVPSASLTADLNDSLTPEYEPMACAMGPRVSSSGMMIGTKSSSEVQPVRKLVPKGMRSSAAMGWIPLRLTRKNTSTKR